MYVKICANTNLADATLAVELGADALGFVFAESSSRRVYPDQVAAIVQSLPSEDVDRIGVFQKLDFKEIRETINIASLTGAQLHGAFDPELVQALRDEFGGRIEIIQSLHWMVGAGVEEAAAFEDAVTKITDQNLVSRILVDAKTPKASGGTGLSFDWSAAQPSVAKANHVASVIVAGGLNPSNVAEAIALLKPWGVDVASGVESAPGKKDPAKLAAFIRNARS